MDVYYSPIDLHIHFGYDMINVIDDSPYILNFKCTDFERLNNYLHTINWDLSFLDCYNIDSLVDRFYGVLLLGFDLFVPLKLLNTSNHPPWYNPSILKLKNRKRKAYILVKYNKFKTAAMYACFSSYVNFYLQNKNLHIGNI